MKVMYFIGILTMAILSGCSKTAQVQLTGFQADSLRPESKYWLLDSKKEKQAPDSLFSAEIQNPDGEYFRLNSLIVYLKPGDRLTITSKDKKLVFSGDRVKENEWLNQPALQYQSLVTSLKREEMAGCPYDRYKEIVKRDAAALRASLNDFSDRAFKENMEKRICFLEIDAYMNYYSMLVGGVYRKEKEEMMKKGEHRQYNHIEAEKVVRERMQEKVAPIRARVLPGVEEMLTAVKNTADIGTAQAQQLLYKLAMIDEEMLKRSGYEAFCEIYRVHEFSLKRATQVYTSKAGELERNTKDPYLKEVVQELCREYRHLQPGREATDCVLETMDGKTIKLSDLKGKPLLIDLWYVQCAPCREFMPVYDRIAKAYKEKGITFLSISTDRKRGDWLKYKNEHKSPENILQLRDAGGDFQRSYLVTSAPRVILIDEGFKIVNAQILERKEEKLRAVLDDFLNN